MVQRIYEYRREKRIEEIAELIKNIKIKGEVFDKKKVLAAIRERYNVSSQTAGDYLGVAIFKNELA